MTRFKIIKLASCLARRSAQSSRNYASPTLDNLSHWGLFCGVCNSPPVSHYVNVDNARETNKKTWTGALLGSLGSTRSIHATAKQINEVLWPGALLGRLGLTRSFHATGLKFMATKNYYDVLGVRKYASPAEIKEAYYRLAKKLHPDINKDDANTKRKFQEVQKAYEVLKDDASRYTYNQGLKDDTSRYTYNQRYTHGSKTEVRKGAKVQWSQTVTRIWKQMNTSERVTLVLKVIRVLLDFIRLILISRR